MEEKFLHFIWQYQYIDKPFVGDQGEKIQAVHPGDPHNDSGPDFAGAKVKVDELMWSGHVEVHVKSSEWKAHKHHLDRAYDNVILHVVWENDSPVIRLDGSHIPTLSLKNRVDPGLYDRYRKLIRSSRSIPCQAQFGEVHDLVKISTLDRVVIERVIAKSQVVNDLLKNNHGDWDEVTYQLLAKNFGFKVNSEPFAMLSRYTPYKTALKCGYDLTRLEALFYGQAGFLSEDFDDEYYKKLSEEYFYLAHKYKLVTSLSYYHWKFLRLRPANFPTIRIAQFAKLLFEVKHLFSWIIECSKFEEIRTTLNLKQSDYWKNHYHFNKPTKETVGGLGKGSAENLIVNTVVPVLVAYGKSVDDQQFIDRALRFLQELPPEKNKIVRTWQQLGMKATTAYDTQGLIELYNVYCTQKRCLDCVIGNDIIKAAR